MGYKAAIGEHVDNVVAKVAERFEGLKNLKNIKNSSQTFRNSKSANIKQNIRKQAAKRDK